MTFLECFTIDIQSRMGVVPSGKDLLLKMVFDPGYRAVTYYRIAIYLRSGKFPRKLWRFVGRLILVRINRIPGLEIRTRYPIGEGFSVFHAHDVVIGVGARIGRNVTIYNGVTLGARTLMAEEDESDLGNRYPTIGDGVTIFPGAKLVGPIEIGDDCIIGANSVVNRSFPPNSIVAGSPARLVRMRN